MSAGVNGQTQRFPWARVGGGWRIAVDPSLASAGMLMLALLPAFLVLNSIDSRAVDGVGAWVKPAKFSASLAVHLFTLALLWSWVGDWTRSWTGWLLTRTVVLSAVLEIAYIAFRAARGEPSHYNLETHLSALMFQLMGVGATLLVLIPAVAGAVAGRRGAMGHVLGRSIVLGLVLSGVLGLLTGAFLAGHGGHFVGTPAQDATTWPIVGWSRTVGDLRAAHFVGLHTLQVLPCIGWLASRFLPGKTAMNAVDSAALVLTTITLVFAGLAYRGVGLG